MQFPSKRLVILSMTLLLAACNENTAQAPQTEAKPQATNNIPAPAAKTAAPQSSSASTANLDDPNVVVIVNGSPVTKPMYAAFHQQWRQARQGAKGDTQQEQMAILNELVNAMLIVQDAESQNLHQKAEVEVLLNLLRTRALAEMSIANFVQQQQISDDDLKKLYDERYDSKQVEFKAKHILLAAEEEAKDVIKELDDGADFAELAKTKSTGPSASQGGDLGWFDSTQMVKPFADAVSAMNNGAHSTAPVKTQFGWHVILREDSRETSPPSFEDVQANLLDGKRRELVMEYVTGLRKKADIKIRQPEKTDADAATQ